MAGPPRVINGLIPERHIERTREPMDPDEGEWGEDPESIRESDSDPDPWIGEADPLDSDEPCADDGAPDDRVVVSVAGRAEAVAQLLRLMADA